MERLWLQVSLDAHVHRIGRTGRAGRKGDAYTLLQAEATHGRSVTPPGDECWYPLLPVGSVVFIIIKHHPSASLWVAGTHVLGSFSLSTSSKRSEQATVDSERVA